MQNCVTSDGTGMWIYIAGNITMKILDLYLLKPPHASQTYPS